MKTSRAVSLALLLLLPAALSAQRYTCASPEGRNVITLDVGDSLRLSVSRGGSAILRPSTIGLSIEGEEFFGARSAVRTASTRAADTLLRPEVRQKSALIRDRYNELTLEFVQPFSVTLRAFDDGIAYRFSTRLAGERNVAGEIAQFAFPESSVVTFPEEESFQSHNERTYLHLPIGEIGPERFCSTPALVSVPGGMSAVITESDLDDYPGLWLGGDSLRHSLRGLFPHAALETEQKGDRDVRVTKAAPYLARTAGTRAFPWRLLVTADRDAALIESQLVYQLAKPCTLKETSWIRPGKVAWDWWNDLNITGVDFPSGVNTKTYKYYIDFASSHGLEYVILDEGWYPLGDLLSVTPGIDVAEVIRYGRKKHVGVILWVVWKTLDDQLAPALERFAKWGAAGVKVDFMQRDDQWMVNYYRKIARAAAEHRLLVDFHGACKPTGLSREYPNVLTHEGVKGLEHSKWSAGASPENALVIPFVRGVAGPFDYTPGAMRNATERDFRPVFSTPMSQGTRCQQLAMYVAYDSPLQMLSDAPSEYLREPLSLKFLSGVPTVWDETRGLDGRVSDFLVVARRSGEVWYVGAMTDWTGREVAVDFSFLPPGRWEAEVFQDGPNARRNGKDFTHLRKSVRKSERWIVSLAPGGGWVARISRAR